MNLSSSFICKYPFTYVSKDASGYCKPCCRYELDEEDYTDLYLRGNVEEAFQSSTFEKIRNKMIKKERIPGCQKCYDEEENGFKSMGRFYTEGHSHFHSGVLKGINVGFSRKCNLACRMCGPNFSTKWDNLWKNLNPNDKKMNRKCVTPENIKQIISSEDTLKSIEVLDIVGGEPFIDNFFYQFLEQLKSYDLPNKKINITTNGTIFPKKNVLDTLLQFKELNIGISVDGITDLGEYIRAYSNWPLIDKVVSQWSELKIQYPSIYLYSYTTVSAYNVHDLYSIFKWCLNKNIDFRFHVLYHPEYLKINTLPKTVRRKIYDYYAGLPDFKKNLSKLKTHLFKKSSGNIRDFLDFTDKLDKLLEQNFFHVNHFYTRYELLNNQS